MLQRPLEVRLQGVWVCRAGPKDDQQGRAPGGKREVHEFDTEGLGFRVLGVLGVLGFRVLGV